MPVGTQARPNAVALQADGRIVVAGYAVIGGQAEVVVARDLS